MIDLYLSKNTLDNTVSVNGENYREIINNSFWGQLDILAKDNDGTFTVDLWLQPDSGNCN